MEEPVTATQPCFEHVATVEEFRWQGPFKESICRLDLIKDGNRLLIVATERQDNPGMSVTNAAESLWAAVTKTYPGEFEPWERYDWPEEQEPSLSRIELHDGHVRWFAPSPFERKAINQVIQS